MTILLVKLNVVFCDRLTIIFNVDEFILHSGTTASQSTTCFATRRYADPGIGAIRQFNMSSDCHIMPTVNDITL